MPKGMKKASACMSLSVAKPKFGSITLYLTYDFTNQVSGQSYQDIDIPGKVKYEDSKNERES